MEPPVAAANRCAAVDAGGAGPGSVQSHSRATDILEDSSERPLQATYTTRSVPLPDVRGVVDTPRATQTTSTASESSSHSPPARSIAVRTASKSKKKPPTASCVRYESHRMKAPYGTPRSHRATRATRRTVAGPFFVGSGTRLRPPTATHRLLLNRWAVSRLGASLEAVARYTVECGLRPLRRARRPRAVSHKRHIHLSQ